MVGNRFLELFPIYGYFWPPWFLSFARPNGRQGPKNRITLRSLHPTPTPPKGPGFWGFLDPKGGFSKSGPFRPNQSETYRIDDSLRHRPTKTPPDPQLVPPPGLARPNHHRTLSITIDHRRNPDDPKKGSKNPLKKWVFRLVSA